MGKDVEIEFATADQFEEEPLSQEDEEFIDTVQAMISHYEKQSAEITSLRAQVEELEHPEDLYLDVYSAIAHGLSDCDVGWADISTATENVMKIITSPVDLTPLMGEKHGVGE